MAELESPIHTTLNYVYQAIEKAADEEHRPHLGMSLIGEPCERRLWYVFRWAAREKHDGRMLRLFATGNRFEPVIIKELRAAGLIIECGADEGQQYRVSDHGGHFGGSLDGLGLGVVEAPKSWHVLEFKTHNQKSFDALVKDGVAKHKPLHSHQMNCYMGYTSLDRALYVAENKNTSELYMERTHFDPVVFSKDKAKALRVIKAETPPTRLHSDPTNFGCRFCQFKSICHGDDMPEVNCRTCAHATPLTETAPNEDGTGRWRCELHNGEVPLDFQRQGCSGHRYIPIFLEKHAKQIDMRGGDVVYETKDGGSFANGEGPGAISSAEIRTTGGKGIGALPMAAEVKAQISTAKVVA